MSTLSQFLPASSGGFHTSDPKQLSRIVSTNANLFLRGSSTDYSAAIATFQNLATASDPTEYVGGVYKTVLDVPSGSGFLSAVVGPTSSGAGNIYTTFRITVDGVATEITIMHPSSQSRAAIGRFRPRLSTPYGAYDAWAETGGTVTPNLSSNGSWYVQSVHACQANGLSMLRYSKSLKIEVKHQQGVTAMGSYERHTAIFYTQE